MWGSKAKVRAALLAVFALVFMTVGATAALAQERLSELSITAGSTGCETVTIYYEGPWDKDQGGYFDIPYNSQGTVNGDVRNGNGVGSSQIVFTNVAPGLANWSGSMWWEIMYYDDYDGPQQGQYFDQGTVQVEPCPVTTTTTTTTLPGDTTTSTIQQVETDLPDSAGPGFGLTAAMAAIGVSLLGGAALIAARREN